MVVVWVILSDGLGQFLVGGFGEGAFGGGFLGGLVGGAGWLFWGFIGQLVGRFDVISMLDVCM